MEVARTVARLASDVTFRGSNAGTVEWVSDSVASILGRSPESLVGTQFVELVHPDDLDTVGDAQRAVLGGAPAWFEARVASTTGWRWMSIVVEPVIAPDGRVIGRAGGWRDIDRERRDADAQDALIRRFPFLAEGTADVVCSYTLDGVLEWVSPSVSTVLGFEPEQVIGTRPSWTHPDDRRTVLQLVGDAVASGDRRVGFRCRVLTADRRVVWADAEVQIHRDADGTPRSMSSRFHDITELVQREAALRLRESETDQLLRRRESVLASLIDPTVVLEAVRSPSGAIIDFHYALASASAIEYFGLPLDLLAGTTMLVSFRDQRDSGLFDACVRSVESGEVVRWSAQPLPRTSTGAVRLYDITMVPSGDDLAVTWRDVTDDVARRRELDEALAFNSAVFDASPVGLVVHRPDGAVAACNPAAERLLGLTHDQLTGIAPVAPEWQVLREDGTVCSLGDVAADAVRATGVPVRDRVIAVLLPDGDRTWLSVDAEPLGAAAQLEPCGAVVAFSDITRAHRTLDAVVATAADARALAESTPDVVLKVALDGTIRWVSHASSELLGIAPDDLVGRRNRDLVHPADCESFDTMVADAIATHGPTFITLRVRRGDGSYVWVNSAGADADVPAGAEPYRVVRLRDVDAEVRLSETLTRQATEDALTGALNRATGLGRLAGLLQLGREADTTAAVLFIDIDDFKSVNDLYGHSVGDALLREVAARIQARIRHSDLLIRFGGDELVVVLTDVRTLQHAQHIARGIHDTASGPLEIDDTVIVPRLSCGLTVVDPVTDSLSTVIERADLAMYGAKRAGGNRVLATPPPPSPGHSAEG